MGVDNCDAEKVQVVPMALYESGMARAHKVQRMLVIGWVITIVLSSLLILCAVSTDYETTTETTTTETTTTSDENSADSGDNGVAFAGEGDLTVGEGY